MNRRAIRSGAIAGVILHQAHLARAEQVKSPPAAYPAAHHARLFLGMALGEGSASSSLRTANAVLDERSAFRAAFDFGYSQPLTERFFGLVFLGRIGNLDTEWSRKRGESRYALDIAAGPELRVDVTPRRPNIQWRVFVPAGFTHAWVKPGPGRAVTEDYAPANGWHLGVGTGFDFSGTHVGGYLDLSYVAHFVEFEHTATLKSSPAVTARNDYPLLDQVILLSYGLLYRP